MLESADGRIRRRRPLPCPAFGQPRRPLRRSRAAKPARRMPPMSRLPSPMLERADEARPAAPAADLEPTEALASDQIRPEHGSRDRAAPACAATAPTPSRTGQTKPRQTPLGRIAAQDLLPPGETGALGPVWDELADRAAHYATRARGAGTRRTYKSAWTHFSQWCRDLGREPLCGDPDLIAMYIVRRADDGLTVSSIRVALAAIRTAHQLAGRRARSLPAALSHDARGRGAQPRRAADAPGRPGRPRRAGQNAGRPPLPRLAARHPQPRHAAARVWRGAAPLRAGRPCASATSSWCPGAASPCWCAAPRPTNTDEASRSRSGPTRRTLSPAPPSRSNAGWRCATPRRTSRAASGRRRATRCRCSAAMSKAGRLSGNALSDKAVARLVKRRRRGGRARPGALLRPLAARRARHRRRRPGRRARRPHAPDPAQIHRGRARLPPPRRPLAQQRHRGAVRLTFGRGVICAADSFVATRRSTEAPARQLAAITILFR